MINSDENIGNFIFTNEQELIREILFRYTIYDVATRANMYSGARFFQTGLAKAEPNAKYWESIDFGGGIASKEPLTQNNVSNAIDELFSDKVVYDCATAINAIYFKAQYDFSRSEKKPLRGIGVLRTQLGGWRPGFTMLDDLYVRPRLPGDMVYLHNPGATTPAWQGENLIYLGRGLYYGFGLGRGNGIGTEDEWRFRLAMQSSGFLGITYWDPRLRDLHIHHNARLYTPGPYSPR